MEIQYQYFEKDHLLVQKFSGNWSIDHYTNYVSYLNEIMGLNELRKVFSDIRNLNLKQAIPDLKKLVQFRKEVISKKYLNVLVIESPITTAAINLYQDRLSNKKYDYKYCSTLLRAIELLEIDLNSIEVENILKKLEHRFYIKISDKN